ncbi:MAG: alanine--tRNA ligase [Deltaproteobacteria bacterium]|nr:alanine--tRNA ligase [Deltaproteobacteria bacterium]
MAKAGNEIREMFLDYFRSKGHQGVTSSSVVPKDDPSLLFTNAGMVQFKRLFLGQEKRDYRRAATCQKCFRVSGKHNDLENVGFTPRHHTFFEMLGNFSFGDYFKAEAVVFAWDLLTNGYGLDPARLWVSVHEKDDEAAQLWESEVGVRPERIVRLGDADNFWAMGDTGPCGPCSEIHIDQGPAVGCGRPDCAVGCDCDRYLELWNLVFMQYNRDEAGVMTPLPRPSIDTGMGLERITATVQGKLSNYDSDLFMPIIEATADLAGLAYGASQKKDVSLRVVADHARACAILVGDGVLPSNEGRGYVLRRILRRAARHGRKLGLTAPFLHQVAHTVIQGLQAAYPNLGESRAFIEKVILSEEERFGETLDTGLKLLAEALEETRAQGQNDLAGDTAFKLYDTFGFPLDLTMTIAAEEGLGVDEDGFKAAMNQQKSRSRAAWKGSGEADLSGPLAELTSQGFTTAFTGYDGLTGSSKVVMLLAGGDKADAVGQGQTAEVITEKTPFYGEAGGQVGDVGAITWPGGEAKVIGSLKPGGTVIVHQVEIVKGSLAVGQEVDLAVNPEARGDTAANHTATHLLHAALREVLGDHVKQSGSLVSPARLRFDFNHFEAMTPPQIAEVERLVNQGVRANVALNTKVMDLEEAVKTGAMALFEERYGDKVRLVEIPGLSRELCGGTHTARTGDIGLFKVVAESSVAAGVRRLEALTGAAAVAAVQALEDEAGRAAALLKVGRQGLAERVEKLLAAQKAAERQVEELKARLAGGGGGADLLSKAEDINGIKALITAVEVDNPKSLREASDNLMDRLGSGVLVLAAALEGKAFLLVRVSKDLTKRVAAGNLIKAMAPLVGGGGGGKPELAQAGGQDPSGLDAALAKAKEMILAS